MDYRVIRAAGNIKRFHTVLTIGEQTIASHSWNVAMIVMTIKPDASTNLLKAALVHDMAEIETGDIPAQVKWSCVRLANAVKDIEEDFEAEHDIIFPLTEEEALILKIADMMELVQYVHEQWKMGNRHLEGAFIRGVDYLNRLELNHEAKEMLASILKEHCYV